MSAIKEKKETMTSRTRVTKTLNHEITDRFPIDLGCQNSTGISAFAYWNLLEYLGLDPGNIEISDCVQFLARVDHKILERFHCDLIYLDPPFEKKKKWQVRDKYSFFIPQSMNPVKKDDGSWEVRQGTQIMNMPAEGFFFDGAWLRNWKGLSEDQLIEMRAKNAELIYKETEYAVNYIGGFSTFLGASNVERLMQMAIDPDAVAMENKIKSTKQIERLKKVIDRMGKYIQLITIVDDMGTQNGPIVSPETIRQCNAPALKEFCDYVHENSDCKVFLHSCGSVKPLLPLFIECGVDVFNPVQISANNMEPRELKQEFGNDIIFWGGGCNTQSVLGVKSPEDVKKNVKELVSVFKPDGSFVFNAVHNIMGNVPPENIIAMYDTAYIMSFY